MKTYLLGLLKRIGLCIGMPIAAIGVLLGFFLYKFALSILGPVYWLITGKKTLLDKADQLEF